MPLDESIRRRATKKIGELQNNSEFLNKLSFSIEWSKQGVFTSKFEGPTDVAVKAAAMDIRNFLMPTKNDLNMGHLLNELRTSIPDTRELDNFRAEWNRIVDDNKKLSSYAGLSLEYNSSDITVGQLLDLFNNGLLFHSENIKAGALESLSSPGFRELTWFVFVSVMQDLAQRLFYFRDTFLE